MAQLREASGGEILEDLRKLQGRLLKLKESKSELRGAMSAEEKHASELISSLTSDRFRHIDQRHTSALIDVRTHSLANQDLDTYYRALDKALMAFHSVKMKEINETLKEYWRSVYKGADIDEIYIVSDGAIIGPSRTGSRGASEWGVAVRWCARVAEVWPLGPCFCARSTFFSLLQARSATTTTAW